MTASNVLFAGAIAALAWGFVLTCRSMFNKDA